MPEETVKLFVFGILKSDGRAFHRKECIDVEEDTLPLHDMYSVSGMYPASVKGKGIIHGETHTYPATILSLFDGIEGYDSSNPDSPHNLYTREKAITGNGNKVQYYLFNRSVELMAKVESGVWDA